ncbi:unnamed protein product [Cylicostephanus goldi]|uniref:Uncharacterized protein n=1 Tax=Cylicostephanus goldi TaxID=71465 RepID=A0A3P6S595_CYLGO|nr:unnamed protein product [Cylicostephanus goldi]
MFFRYASLEEQRRIEQLSKDDRDIILAEKLPVEVNSEMSTAIQRCYDQYSKLRDDVDMAATVFRSAVRGVISPKKIFLFETVILPSNMGYEC